MATGSGQMAPGRLGWQQSLTTWHQGRRDCDRAWPHGTRVAWVATGHGQMTPGRLGLHQGLANVTRVAGMSIVPGNMTAGRLGWQQGLATWHQAGWVGNRV